MKRGHKQLMVVAVLVILVAWLAWNALLVESDMPAEVDPAAQNNGAN